MRSPVVLMNIMQKLVQVSAAVLVGLSCAEPSPVETGPPPRTVVVMNALEDGSTVFLSGDVEPDSVPARRARRVRDTRGTGFGPPPRGVIVETRAPYSAIGYTPAWRAGELLLVHGAAGRIRRTQAIDTLGPRPDVANIRIALAAPDAPLVRVFVLPAGQPVAGSLNWLSMQSPYVAPLVTGYFRGQPQLWRVHFSRYAPGSAEPLLASTDPFPVGAGEGVTVLFSRSGGSYTAAAVQEPPLAVGQ
ncbi:MAG: hypothetical protein ACT4OZ_01995 [Gemmatimonadota bacterium]